MPMPESVPRKLPSCCLVRFAIVVMIGFLSFLESAQCGLDSKRPTPCSLPVNTRSAAKGLGILQRSGGRGDPSEAGRGKFLLTSFKSTKPVGRHRRFCSVAIARNRACARGKFLFTGGEHGVSLRASRMQLGVGLKDRKGNSQDGHDCKADEQKGRWRLAGARLWYE